ncbi:MAG TPA: S16 family serine protease, partial [Tepidisphaeraceae bacterium]|nr:S16 family serine protease [Tepidisphaeraceae bacterium]
WDWLDGQHDSSPPAETGDQAGDEFPVGHAAHIARPQATIKILVVWENSGVALGGRATDFILTVTPANKPRPVTGHFVGHVGKEMSAVFGDVLRYIRVRHPSWYAANAEFSFAEREDYDGPSIGAAIGTLIGSVIDGFQIDPSAAITGDVSADGNVHAIGALAYKLHGAAAAHCDVVAVPMENYDNLVDAVIYSGPSIVTDVQVIGISTLDDAVGVMRSDRDPKLAQAISLFAGIQDQLKQSPGSLHRPEIQSQLQQILSLAPNHLSAKLLLLYGQNKLPRTLSATASLYYTRMAVYTMLPILSERAKFDPEHRVPSSTVQEQLADLDKLRPIADPEIQPFIDAWTHFIRALVTLQNGYGSADGVRTAYQRLLDESAKIDADPDLSQKLLDEGM